MTDWQQRDNLLIKEFVFKNFLAALEFVNAVGWLAEEMNHHPDIKMHDYKKVTLILTTHNVGGVTAKDFELSEKINAL